MEARSSVEPSTPDGEKIRSVDGVNVRLDSRRYGGVLTIELEVPDANRSKAAELIEAIGGLLTRVVDQRDGRAYDALIDQVQSLATTVSSTDGRWNELIGPFYDTSGLERWLGVSRQRLHQRVRGGDLLAIKAQNGSLYYPAWQFRGDGTVVGGVPEVIRALGGRSPFNVALWLRSPRPEFSDRTAIEVLANGDPDDVATIVDDARADGAAWAR